MREAPGWRRGSVVRETPNFDNLTADARFYAEGVLPEAATKAGMFFLTETKKDGDKYVGKTNGRVVKAAGGPSCRLTWPIEFTLVTPDRIEGRSFMPPANAKIDWNTCSYTPPADWQPFVCIPVK